MGNTEIKVYEFKLFGNNPEVKHGIFTRKDRTFPESFYSMNGDIISEDEHSAISNNRKLITRKMGMKPLIFLNQTHGDAVIVLKKDDNDLSQIFDPGKETYAADGIITDMKDIFLVIQAADCQSVMLCDPEKKVIANIHSGWRGSIANIIGKAVGKMMDAFQCKPENILAGISPSLGPCCSEFINYKDEIPEIFWKYRVEDTDFFDFWKISEDQLLDKGLKKANIENMGICTKCHQKDFYSYRGEKTTGRFACVISLCG